ncbi:MAG: translation initiation factor IF-1 [Patescibacteria group bacterium]|nr:translation initiation factor IF-1 [Patescibacteria group bacterium]
MPESDKQDPAAKESTGVVVGTVVEALPNTLFKVKIEPDKEIMAYLAGKMRLYRIRVLVGDRVELVLDPYGGKGRITRRLRQPA